MMIPIDDPFQKEQPKKDRDEGTTGQPNKPKNKIVILIIATCLIFYVASVALIQIFSNRTQSKETNDTISNLTLMNMYAIMVLGASVFIPCDRITSQIHCLKYLKLVFICVSLTVHFISLAMCTVLIYYANAEMMAAVALQTMGIVFHGLYLRAAIIRVFNEPADDYAESFVYDVSPLFGIPDVRY